MMGFTYGDIFSALFPGSSQGRWNLVVTGRKNTRTPPSLYPNKWKVAFHVEEWESSVFVLFFSSQTIVLQPQQRKSDLKLRNYLTLQEKVLVETAVCWRMWEKSPFRFWFLLSSVQSGSATGQAEVHICSGT